MKRVFAIFLTCVFLLGLLPTSALAAEPDTGGLCPHHLEHSYEVCGYIEAVEGHPCGHVHDGSCGYAPEVADAPCQHEHDPDCGYVPAVLSQLCGYVCSVCPVQAMIDALPTAEELSGMSEDEQNEVYNALQEAHDAYEALTEVQQEEITGADVFEILFAFFNGMVNLLEANVVSIADVPVAITADPCTPDCPGHIITGTSTANTITVESGTHDITLQDVKIDVSDQSGTAAFSIQPGAKVNLTLVEDNTLKSGDNCAGLQVPDGAELVITESSTGSLEVTGGFRGAGIGGGSYGAGGTITISGGTVDVTSGHSGAGIGGGQYGTGGKITITGGTVTATGSDGAGIGGGGYKAGDTIIITGGTVTATGGSGAGIGGGRNGAGGKITINGGTVTATGSNAAGIGGGMNGGRGTFIANGNAFIITSPVNVNINKDNWSGVIFIGNSGGIYGNQTLPDSLTEIESGKTLTIPDGSSLTIPNDKTLINKGTIIVEPGGQLVGNVNGNPASRPSSETGITAVSVSGTPGNIDGTTITVALPYGADPTQISITLADENATFSPPATTDNGKTWTFTVTAQDKITTKDYTIKVSIAPDPAAGNKADVAKAKTAIETHTWTVGQATANTAPEVRAWIEDQLAAMSLNGVNCAVSITGFTAATAGDSADHDGADGSFTFTVSLSKGADDTLAEDTATGINGTITATPYQAKNYTVSVTASPTEGGTVSGGGTYEENTSVKVSASANSGYHFVKWTEGGKEVSTSADYAFTVTSSRTLTAVFEENSITPPDPGHVHAWATVWSRSSTHHWHDCTAQGCDIDNSQKDGYALHTPGGWIVDTRPTSSTSGQQHKECAVCGYITQTETIPATGGGNSGGDSYTPPTYKPDVSVPNEGGGAPSVSPSRPERGDTVIVTPRPDEGYEVDRITVTGPNGKPIEVTKKPDGTYTFTQPSGKVKIEVTYQPVKPVEIPWNNPFTDVAEGAWYYEAVRFVQERGLMNGYSDGRFGPNDTLSRAQLAQILFNKEGRPVVNYLLQFDDVAGEAWYTEAIRWATSQGIVGGYGNGMFGPNDPITREQLAVILWRYSGSPAATDKELHFNDTDEISGFALDAMRWAVENGILNGYGDGRLGPQGQATRAQVAQMLKNFFEKG